ncbi:MAG: hypothetical protein IT435_18570 [Phycisphaerales bacterium]|nr:hypothetical protein [Phycisphaerales bacterium]
MPLALCLFLPACESADKGVTGRSRWDTTKGPPPANTSTNAGDDFIRPSRSGSDRPVEGSLAYASHPFDPISMRIHPLTHIQRTEDVAADSAASPKPITGPRINCFVEFKDQWGDTCKALGLLQVQLYRPATEPGQERQDATWDADLTNLDKNADWFDPVTRSYRLQLEIPEWLGDPAKNNQVKLRLVFTPASTDGEMRPLRDEFVVTQR